MIIDVMEEYSVGRLGTNTWLKLLIQRLTCFFNYASVGPKNYGKLIWNKWAMNEG